MKDKQQKKTPGRPPRHGAYSLMVKAGELPERRTYLRAYLMEVREGLIRDLGPTEADLTTGQRVILDRAVSKLSILRCIEEHVKEEGVFRGRELSPVLAKSYVTYAEALRRDLQVLGLGQKRADEVLDLGKYIEQTDAEKAPAKAKGGREIKQPGRTPSDVSEAEGGKVEEVGQDGQGDEPGPTEDGRPGANQGDESGQGEGERP